MDGEGSNLSKEIEFENDLNLIFQNTTSEIFVADKNGVCLQVNPECEKNLGLSAEQLIGRNVRELVEMGLFTNSTTLKVIEEKKPITLIQETKNGQKLFATGIPVFGENGDIIRVISTSINITEILKFQNKMQEMEAIIGNYDREIQQMRASLKFSEGHILTNDATMKRIYELLERVKDFDSTVLLLGESGVGKSEIANWIHRKSDRSKNKFIEVNCAAIPNNLFESELFGYEPGTFSGGLASGKKGLALEAHKGTLFLDEIGELPLELQSKILHFIQSKSFRKVGGTKLETIDVRIITATNRDLEKMISEGEFREDLYYRLSVIPVKIPPLRERKDDLISLIFMIIENINTKYNRKYVFTDMTIQALQNYHWPGNIRELKNTIERICVTSKHEIIDLDFKMLGLFLNFAQQPDYTNGLNFSQNHEEEKLIYELLDTNHARSLKERVKLFENYLVSKVYNEVQSMQVVAEKLKTSQSSISRKLNK